MSNFSFRKVWGKYGTPSLIIFDYDTKQNLVLSAVQIDALNMEWKEQVDKEGIDQMKSQAKSNVK